MVLLDVRCYHVKIVFSSCLVVCYLDKFQTFIDWYLTLYRLIHLKGSYLNGIVLTSSVLIIINLQVEGYTAIHKLVEGLSTKPLIFKNTP